MKGRILDTSDPFFNLALEDFLLHNYQEEFCLIYFNNPAVMVGRHQIIYREVDVFEARNLGIPVIRRISGGGTVFHDMGNLNFSLIRNTKTGMQVDFTYCTKPVIEFLNRYGVPAVLSGKSDITVDGFKISGNAEHVYRERVLHHGTLLFDTSLVTMSRLIRGKTAFYNTKAVESNRSPVMNLKGRIRETGSADQLAEKLFEYLCEYFKITDLFQLNDDIKPGIEDLADSRYRSWEWNYGFSPPYEFTGSFVWNGELHRTDMYVKDGIIWKCTIEGSDDMSLAAKELIGCRHLYEDIANVMCNKVPSVDKSIIISFF